MQLQQNGCTSSDTININVNPPPLVNLGPDTGVCISSSLKLDAGNIGSLYRWNTGDTSRIITVYSPGKYSVTVSSGNCATSGAITVRLGGCKPLLPSAFTPNRDGMGNIKVKICLWVFTHG